MASKPNNMIAKVQINDTFQVTGRGLILAGELLEGDFYSGAEITFRMQNKPYCFIITGKEMGGYRKNERGNLIVGLLVRANEQETKELYQNPQIQGVIAEIHSEE
jgi:hypothetical protein